MHVHDTLHMGRMNKGFTVSVNIKFRNAIAFNTVNRIRINTPLLFRSWCLYSAVSLARTTGSVTPPLQHSNNPPATQLLVKCTDLINMFSYIHILSFVYDAMYTNAASSKR